MITDIRIKNYRGVVEGQIDGLRQLSVITGTNNAAKTTALESLILATASRSITAGTLDGGRLAAAVFGHRALRGEVTYSLFPDIAQPAMIQYTGDGASDYCYVVHRNSALFLNDGNGNAQAMSTQPGVLTHYRTGSLCFVAAPTSPDPGNLEDSISVAEQLGYRHEMLRAARHVDHTINDLRILMVSGNPTLHAETQGGPRPKVWPVAVGGTGFKRYLTVAAQTAGATGLVCLDDPDAFLHPGLLKHLAALIWDLVKSGAQVVLATHNPDLIDKLAEPINDADSASKFCVYGFTRSTDGKLTCAARLPGAVAQNPKRIDAIRQLLGLN